MIYINESYIFTFLWRVTCGGVKMMEIINSLTIFFCLLLFKYEGGWLATCIVYFFVINFIYVERNSLRLAWSVLYSLDFINNILGRVVDLSEQYFQQLQTITQDCRRLPACLPPKTT